MKDKIARYPIKIERCLFQKFRYVSEYEGSSTNKEIEQYIKKRVFEYEKEHGKIEFIQEKN